MLSHSLLQLAAEAEGKIAPRFAAIDGISQRATGRVLEAFARHRVSDACFAGTTGYGYDDAGREKLEAIYADVFGCESALVRQGFVNGSHAIGCAMLAGMQMGDTLLSATGPVYDTLQTLLGKRGPVGGTFPEQGLGYREVALRGGRPDLPAIEKAAAAADVAVVFVQRSRGYGTRESLAPEDIGQLVQVVRAVNPRAAVVVDNCYGEFCADTEPTHHGADLICGSLIKNPGGGLAPAGGYIAGRADLVARVANRMSIPGIGGECGPTLGLSRLMFQGFFMAPHTVAQALKTATFAAALLESLGCTVSPRWEEARPDIIQTVAFGEPAPLLAFCRGIQAGAPVDSFATPEPWDMPGYDCPVVMAAGAFVQGASIELSCDAPMRPPYTAYMQGGLTYESGKYGILRAAQALMEAQI